ncbi:unnamed protein product [Soboliphyme baturini]|uniref:Uncharacterized protein n=1 Tax=Soboliphyme baturini TaxID=241478 RepID=A0A183IDR6_9BILA|nr:unnamed protein product [Soboliphyme baturini]
MVELFGIGEEAESIIAGVIGFLAVGFIIFFICFVVNKIYIWYRQRQNRKRRKLHGIGDDDDQIIDITSTSMIILNKDAKKNCKKKSDAMNILRDEMT